MGLTLEEINQGAADIGSIISKGMEAFNAITGKTSASTGGIVAPATQQPATNPTEQTQGVATASTGINTMVLVGAALLLVLVLARR